MTEVATIFEALAAKAATKRELSPGEALFRVGDRVKAVYVIATGRLRLIRTSTGGGEVTLHRAKAGESFAEASLFSERYHCNAVAEVTSEVLAYPKTRIINGFADHPERLMVLLRHLGAQVQALRARAEILSLHAATDRLMAYFSLHMPPDVDVLAIDSTWKQIATEIGLSHEALYRALARLDDSGVIERDGSKVRLTAR